MIEDRFGKPIATLALFVVTFIVVASVLWGAKSLVDIVMWAMRS